VVAGRLFVTTRRLLFVHSQAGLRRRALTAAGTVAHEEILYEDECWPGRSRSSAGRRRLRGHGVGELQDEFVRHG
jgi:hypothetical protein